MSKISVTVTDQKSQVDLQAKQSPSVIVTPTQQILREIEVSHPVINLGIDDVPADMMLRRGWAFVQDSLYPSTNPMMIPAGQRTKILNNAGGVVATFVDESPNVGVGASRHRDLPGRLPKTELRRVLRFSDPFFRFRQLA